MKKWGYLAPILVILAGICWGVIGIFTRKLSEANLDAIQITELRCLVASLILIIFLLITDRKKLSISIKDFWMFIGTGILSIAFFNICYFFCIQISTLSIACILLYTSPCFVMIISCIVFREMFTVQKFISLLISSLGCAFVVGIFAEKLQISALGLIVGLGSGLGYALYSIFGRIALKKYSWLTVITYTFLVASIALLPFCHPYEVYRAIINSSSVAIRTVFLGIFSTLLPFLLYTKGLEHMETSKAALLTFVEPVVATIVGAIIFKESFSTYNTVGIVLIMISIRCLL